MKQVTVKAGKALAVTINHTERQYDGFTAAYSHFNAALFKGALPHCLITLQRHKGAYGYFCPERFQCSDAPAVDEIAMNPTGFLGRSNQAVLSTLVHEMVHLWQQHFGKAPKGNYHNKEWGTRMKELGLYPSSTAKPGGKETGAKVSHYVLSGGGFEVACEAFLRAHSGFALYSDIARDEKTAKKKAASKTKYTCPDCDVNAWAKPSTLLHCGECEVPMVAEEKED